MGVLGYVGFIGCTLGYVWSSFVCIAFVSIEANIRSLFEYVESTLGYIGSTLGYIGSTLEYIKSTLRHIWSTFGYFGLLGVYWVMLEVL